jgi:hypothetical protein
MVEGTTKLRTALTVNDIVVPLNPFVQRYIGNVLRAIVASLDCPGTKVHVYIDRYEIKLYSDDKEVPLKKEFARLFIESTIKGVLSPLKGIFWLERVNIATWEE